jgi:hypothetical protein
VMDCIYSELKDVKNLSLIQYVLESIQMQKIRSFFESFCGQEEKYFGNEDSEQDENNIYLNSENEEYDDTFTTRTTIRGQKEKEEEKEKQQQKTLHL